MGVEGIAMDIKFRGWQAVTSSKYYARLPKQVQRALPIYGIIVFILILLNLSAFGSGVSAVGRGFFSGTPAHPDSIFPKKIWQTWKVDPLGFAQRDLAVAKTWTTKNPGHRYEVLTDTNDMYYVETYYGPHGFNRPDIVDTYRALTLKIIKADLLRYLVMYAEGGLYTDIDVEALKPISRFIPERYNEADIDMVVGVEIDQPNFNDHPILGKKSQSFCQWTFMCKPQLPVMLHLVDSIIAWLNRCSKEQGVPIGALELDFDEVISGTGPSAFTNILLKEISKKEGHAVTWASFHALAESKLVGGVLVLTVEAFAAGQGHSDSGNHNAKTAMVKHKYHASGWPTKHPRYKHPVYGEVERCNWKTECVKLWDSNIANFEKLSEDEKAKLIGLKDIQDVRDSLKPPKTPAAAAAAPALGMDFPPAPIPPPGLEIPANLPPNLPADFPANFPKGPFPPAPLPAGPLPPPGLEIPANLPPNLPADFPANFPKGPFPPAPLPAGPLPPAAFPPGPLPPGPFPAAPLPPKPLPPMPLPPGPIPDAPKIGLTKAKRFQA